LSILQGTGIVEAVRNIIPACSAPGIIIVVEHLQAKEVIIGDGEHRRRYIFCYNPLDTERQRLHREEIVRLLEKDLACHHDHCRAGYPVARLQTVHAVQDHFYILTLYV